MCSKCQRAEWRNRREQIATLWNQGFTAKEIAAKIGGSANGIATTVDRLRRLGEPIDLHRGRNRALWPEIKRRMEAGERSAEIAAALGITTENLWRQRQTMKESGIV